MAHIPRLYVPGRIPVGPLLLPADASRRLSTVLRVREGDALRLFNGAGVEWQAAVSSVVRGLVHVTVGEVTRQEPPAAVTLETWCPLVRPNRFDWMVEKCVEAGADVIRPLATAHVSRGDGASAARQERWRRIVVEAAEQSGRLFVPSVEAPMALENLIARGHTSLVFAEQSGRPIGDLAPLLPVSGHLALAVGPEGGWSEEEIRRARAAGALFLRLGPHVLRSETAAIVGTSVLAQAISRSGPERRVPLISGR